MSVTHLFFDLDETLAPDEAVNVEVFGEVTSALLQPDGAEASALFAELDVIVEHLWRDGPAAAYCARLGISAWEGLWGPFGPSVDRDLAALHRFVPGYRAAAWEQFARAHGARTQDPPRALEERFLRLRRERQRAYPWSASVLKGLANRYRLGVITNGAPDLQRLKLAGTGLSELFQVVVVSGDVGAGKPEPGIFAHAMRLAECAAEQAVMIGDSWDRDMTGAVGVSMRGIWVNPRRMPQPPTVTPARVTSVHDLRDVSAALTVDGPLV